MTSISDRIDLRERIEASCDAPVEKNAGEVLSAYREVMDLRDEINALGSKLAARREQLDAVLLEIHKEQGVTNLADANIGITFNPESFRAKYEPERFDAILDWAVKTNNTNIIQRRITDARVMALIDEGVELPEGLSIEAYTKISVRRK